MKHDDNLDVLQVATVPLNSYKVILQDKKYHEVGVEYFEALKVPHSDPHRPARIAAAKIVRDAGAAWGLLRVDDHGYAENLGVIEPFRPAGDEG
jgi:hypothetical protein